LDTGIVTDKMTADFHIGYKCLYERKDRKPFGEA